MAKQRAEGFAVPLNFLLGGSDSELDSYELARLAEVANLRAELHEILDRVIDTNSQAALARWFRTIDRHTLKAAIQSPEEHTTEILAWARERIRTQEGRSEEERVPRTSLVPGATHLAAALRYQQRNIAEGKCAVCPEPLDPNSVRFCTKHLRNARLRYKPIGAKGAQPGSIGWLHGDMFQSGHGRQLGSLAALEMGREKRTRKFLAELGIPPESAAVSLNAAKEALLKCMPLVKSTAMSQDQLFEMAMIPTKTTGQNALKELLQTDRIERIGKGVKADPYLYFVGATLAENRDKQAKKPKRDANWKIRQNRTIQKILKGETE